MNSIAHILNHSGVCIIWLCLKSWFDWINESQREMERETESVSERETKISQGKTWNNLKKNATETSAKNYVHELAHKFYTETPILCWNLNYSNGNLELIYSVLFFRCCCSTSFFSCSLSISIYVRPILLNTFNCVFC